MLRPEHRHRHRREVWHRGQGPHPPAGPCVEVLGCWGCAPKPCRSHRHREGVSEAVRTSLIPVSILGIVIYVRDSMRA